MQQPLLLAARLGRRLLLRLANLVEADELMAPDVPAPVGVEELEPRRASA